MLNGELSIFLKYGAAYFVGLPTAYLILPLYSLAMIVDRRWGTRMQDATGAPNPGGAGTTASGLWCMCGETLVGLGAGHLPERSTAVPASPATFCSAVPSQSTANTTNKMDSIAAATSTFTSASDGDYLLTPANGEVEQLLNVTAAGHSVINMGVSHVTATTTPQTDSTTAVTSTSTTWPLYNWPDTLKAATATAKDAKNKLLAASLRTLRAQLLAVVFITNVTFVIVLIQVNAVAQLHIFGASVDVFSLIFMGLFGVLMLFQLLGGALVAWYRLDETLVYKLIR